MKRLLSLCLILLLCACQSAPKPDAACHITVSAQPETLPESFLEILPQDGVLFDGEVAFASGENLLAVMTSAMRAEKIPLVTDGGYISGIGGLSPGSAGPMSGWMFTVNGEMPMEGCDEILLADGDTVVWTYVTEWDY